jgi:hypothetical protein
MRLAVVAALAASTACASAQSWKSLPAAAPVGEMQSTGSHIVAVSEVEKWRPPTFRYLQRAATGRKNSKVIVIIYNPTIRSSNARLIDVLKANDPVQYSMILRDVIREASWGYMNYEIVDIIEVDGFTKKVDGFRYTGESFMKARADQNWQPSTTSYRAVLEENNLMRRIRSEKISEVWLWGAGGMHWDEFAMHIPNRYARFAPTDNPWFYRPYDIPSEIPHTFWVMGFNYEVGADNMIHSYVHRIESMAALALGNGIWNTHEKRDPWNVFSWLEMDHVGTASMVGNCHVPPNGQSGYDYNNKRRVESYADGWSRYPDVRTQPRLIGSDDWGNTQFGYMKWILERIPKFAGHTKHGYNNWWVYIGNTDEDLPNYEIQSLNEFRIPSSFPPPSKKPN